MSILRRPGLLVPLLKMVLLWFCAVTPDNAVCLLCGVIDSLWDRDGGHCVSVAVSCLYAAARLIVSCVVDNGVLLFVFRIA